jgi:hypothetical protein
MKKQTRSVGIFASTLAIIAILFLILVFKVQSDNHTPFSIEIDNSGGTASVGGISVSMNCSQSWISDDGHGLSGDIETSVGAEFDGVICNELNYPIEGWSLTVDIPGEVVIDSSWNGTYENTGSQIVVVPDENVKDIPANGEKTFGFVIYTPEEVELSHFVLTGNVHKSIEDFMLFWLLCVALGVWVVVLIVYFAMLIRIHRLEWVQQQNEEIISQTMTTFAEFIDAKDPYTRGHSVRVSYYCQEIAKRMKMREDDVKKLGYIALMHDCGKIGIPDSVLNKPGRLNSEERKVIESHTVLGGQILEKFTAIDGIREGALYHHERYDGKGYPEGRVGRDIPLYARIIGIADSFDAMNSDRCYRRHLPKDVILRELEENAGKQFDPDLVMYMIEMINDGSIHVMDEEEHESENN